MIRSHPPFTRCALFGGLLIQGSACTGEGEVDAVEPFPIVWKGEHIQIGTQEDLDAWCPGTLPALDHQVGTLKQLYEVPSEYLVTYYLYPPPQPNERCPEGALACYVNAAVYTSDLFDKHEIVHAISAAHKNMPLFFEEGGASYWGYALPADFRGLDIHDVLDKKWSDRLSDPEYALAAHFTSYLIHTYGEELYIAISRETSLGQSRTDFEVMFADTIGVALDAAIASYKSDWPYCDVQATQRWYHECEQSPVALLPGTFTDFDLDISCDSKEVIGPSTRLNFDDSPRIWRDVTIELDSEFHDITFDRPGQGEPNSVIMEIRRCDSNCGEVMKARWSIAPNRTTDPNVYNINASPGRYVVRISRAYDDPGPVQFQWYAGGF